MALKEDGMYFVLCPKQGMYSRIIFAKQSQGLIAPPPPPQLLRICRGCQFQAIENATKTQSTTLKTYSKLSLFIFLH